MTKPISIWTNTSIAKIIGSGGLEIHEKWMQPKYFQFVAPFCSTGSYSHFAVEMRRVLQLQSMKTSMNYSSKKGRYLFNSQKDNSQLYCAISDTFTLKMVGGLLIGQIT